MGETRLVIVTGQHWPWCGIYFGRGHTCSHPNANPHPRPTSSSHQDGSEGP